MKKNLANRRMFISKLEYNVETSVDISLVYVFFELVSVLCVPPPLVVIWKKKYKGVHICGQTFEEGIVQREYLGVCLKIRLSCTRL